MEWQTQCQSKQVKKIRNEGELILISISILILDTIVSLLTLIPDK